MLSLLHESKHISYIVVGDSETYNIDDYCIEIKPYKEQDNLIWFLIRFLNPNSALRINSKYVSRVRYFTD